MKTIKLAKWGYMVSSIIFCIMGALIMLFTDVSVRILCYLVGSLLIIEGIIKIIGYFSRDLYQLAFQFDLAMGLLFSTLGLVMLLYPESFISILNFVIGILAIVDGAFKLQTALDAKRFGINKWWFIGAVSVLVSIFGIMLVINPFEGASVVMMIIGITLLTEGILNLMVAIYTIKIIKNKNPIFSDNYLK